MGRPPKKESENDSSSDANHGGTNWKSNLRQVLDGIGATQEISTSEHYWSGIDSGLKIGEDSIVSLPLTESDVQVIKNACPQKPSGKGDQPSIDIPCRWEFDFDQFEFGNPAFFERLVVTASQGLGLEGVTAKPHKLVLCETGSSSAYHKGPRTTDGRIGTIAICLPSQTKGANAHFWFGSEEQVLTSPWSASQISTLAWVSDGPHEGIVLTAGYRLVLLYKLFQEDGLSRTAGVLSRRAEPVKKCLVDWGKNHSKDMQLAYKLDRRYPTHGLSLANVKGRDRAVCQTLSSLVSEHGLYLLFAQLTRTDVWGEETEYAFTYICSSTGGQVATNVKVDEKDIVGATYEGRQPDGDDEAESKTKKRAPTWQYHDTVVLLIRKEHAESLLPEADLTYSSLHGVMKAMTPNEDAANLLEMVDQDLEESTPDEATKKIALKFINEASRRGILCHRDSAGLVAKWSLRLRDKALLAKTLSDSRSVYFGSVKEVDNAVAGVLEKIYAQERPVVDWDKWLGFIVEGGAPAQAADIFLGFQVIRVLGTVSISIDEWSEAALDAQMDAPIPWSNEDAIFVARRLHKRGPDTDWIMGKLLPNVAAGGPQDLLFETLINIMKLSGRYLGKAKSMFEYILTNSGNTLHLKAKDLHYDRRSWSKNLKKCETPTRKFCRMLFAAHGMDAADEAYLVLDATCKGLVATAGEWQSLMGGCAIVRELLIPLINVLKAHKTDPPPSVRTFFVECLEQIQRDLPEQPSKALEGWAHKPRKCAQDADASPGVQSPKSCPDCDALNTFMASSTEQTWNFTADAKTRKHVLSDLPKTMFGHQVLKQGRSQTLVITKLEKEAERAKRERAEGLRDLENGVQPLRIGYVRELLGDEKYGELVLLKKLDVAVVDIADDDEGSGAKRGADDGANGATSKKRRKK